MNLKLMFFLFFIMFISTFVNANKDQKNKLLLHDECGISPRENLKVLSKKFGNFKYAYY
jgi:hypothetical protein